MRMTFFGFGWITPFLQINNTNSLGFSWISCTSGSVGSFYTCKLTFFLSTCRISRTFIQIRYILANKMDVGDMYLFLQKALSFFDFSGHLLFCAQKYIHDSAQIFDPFLHTTSRTFFRMMFRSLLYNDNIFHTPKENLSIGKSQISKFRFNENPFE